MSSSKFPFSFISFIYLHTHTHTQIYCCVLSGKSYKCTRHTHKLLLTVNSCIYTYMHIYLLLLLYWWFCLNAAIKRAKHWAHWWAAKGPHLPSLMATARSLNVLLQQCVALSFVLPLLRNIYPLLLRVYCISLLLFMMSQHTSSLALENLFNPINPFSTFISDLFSAQCNIFLGPISIVWDSKRHKCVCVSSTHTRRLP